MQGYIGSSSCLQIDLLPPRDRIAVLFVSTYDLRVGRITDSDVEDCGVVWLDGDKVCCHDRHRMFIDGEFEVGVGRRVDETNTVFLPWGKLHIVILSRSIECIFPLNETCVSWDRNTREFFLEK